MTSGGSRAPTAGRPTNTEPSVAAKASEGVIQPARAAAARTKKRSTSVARSRSIGGERALAPPALPLPPPFGKSGASNGQDEENEENKENHGN